MLVVGADSDRHSWIREDRKTLIGLWSNSTALDVLLRSISNIGRRVAKRTKKLCLWVFVEHTFTERAEFFPFEAAILRAAVQRDAMQMIGRGERTHDELFVTNGSRERTAEKRYSEVVCIVSLIRDDVF